MVPVFFLQPLTFLTINTDLHRSALTLKPLVGDANNINYLIICHPCHVSSGGIYSAASEPSIPKVDVLETEKSVQMLKTEGQIVMARQLGQSITKTKRVQCS